VCAIVGSSLAFARHLGMARPKACSSQLFVLAIRLALVLLLLFAGNETENIKPKRQAENEKSILLQIGLRSWHVAGDSLILSVTAKHGM